MHKKVFAKTANLILYISILFNNFCIIMNFRLETITDFDFAVGGSANEVVRVSEIPNDVTNSEVNLILWLMLEHEFGGNLNDCNHWDIHNRTRGRSSSTDEPDCLSTENVSNDGQTRFIQIQAQGGLRSRRKSISQIHKARKFAEQILRKAGVNLPFEQLSAAEKRDLFKQFSASSELLRHEKFGSILELFQALRSRSKLREEYEILHQLGSGSSGSVFAVCKRETANQYAAKRISLTLDSIEEMRMTLNESAVLKCLKHSNIVQFHDAWLEMEYDPSDESITDEEQEPLKFYVLMDFCYQSLHQWIEEVREKPNEQLILNILKQIVDGVEFIHLNRVLHLDINTKNILWADGLRSTIKIGDFGLAIKGDYFPDRTGTPPYSAPEQIHTDKSDMYSVGVTIFEVAENISTTSELHDRLSNNNILTEIPKLNEMLDKLLEKDPIQRPGASEFKWILQTTMKAN